MAARLTQALLFVLLCGCGPASEQLETRTLYVMATQVDVTLPRTALERDPDPVAEIERLLRRYERDYYAWADGELATLNRRLSGAQSHAASDAMTALLERAQQVARATDGAFDPGVGALVELWGFHDSEPPGAAPDPSRIRDTLDRHGSILDLVIGGGSIDVSPAAAGRRFTLDLGGIAKGAAIDRVIAYFRAEQIAPALVNAGGDLRVVGTPPDRLWRVGIKAPRDPGLLGRIELGDSESAFTSGDYERYFDDETGRMHHIIDPRTGFPVEHTRAVTVVAADGTTADAAATALLVAGPDRWRDMAIALGIDAVLRVDASGRIEMTSAMRDRFQPDPERGSDIIVVGN